MSKDTYQDIHLGMKAFASRNESRVFIVAQIWVAVVLLVLHYTQYYPI